jgi:hypothetical protein
MRRNRFRRETSPEPEVGQFDESPLESPEYQAHRARDQIPGDSDHCGIIDRDKRVHAVHRDVAYAIDDRPADE